MAMEVSWQAFQSGNPADAVNITAIKGLNEIGIAVVSQAKPLCPVDKGQLVNSIMYKLANGQKGGFNDGKPGKGGKTPVETADREIGRPSAGDAYVGTASDHAFEQEFGTRYMVAQPFMRPAVEIIVQKGEVQKVLASISREEMEKELAQRKKLVAEGRYP